LAAWDFIKREGGKLEMAVVNPTAVLGPALGADSLTRSG
jgi:dihydroflavonol-4-reductase